jgi:hypothetical protein
MHSTPHSSCRKGKKVMIKTRSGDKIITKFIERTAKYIVTEAGKFLVSEIDSFTIYKPRTKGFADGKIVCPQCGGHADNGHDRELPPNPYVCTKCEEPND